jgi:hypothetical protein
MIKYNMKNVFSRTCKNIILTKLNKETTIVHLLENVNWLGSYKIKNK